MSGKKLFRPSAWLRIVRQIQPPYARPCDRGSSIMLSLGAKKCPPKKETIKTRTHSYLNDIEKLEKNVSFSITCKGIAIYTEIVNELVDFCILFHL